MNKSEVIFVWENGSESESERESGGGVKERVERCVNQIKQINASFHTHTHIQICSSLHLEMEMLEIKKIYRMNTWWISSIQWGDAFSIRSYIDCYKCSGINNFDYVRSAPIAFVIVQITSAVDGWKTASRVEGNTDRQREIKRKTKWRVNERC